MSSVSVTMERLTPIGTMNLAEVSAPIANEPRFIQKCLCWLHGSFGLQCNGL